MGAIAYVFTPKGIQWDNKIIRGYTYLPHGRAADGSRASFHFPTWSTIACPYPPGRSARPVSRGAAAPFGEPGLTLFNPEFLDKWRVYEILRTDDALQTASTRDSVCGGISSSFPLSREHRRVYLKMADGSWARGPSGSS